MARGRRVIKGNPWAICRAAQKRHGFGRKKLERCILEVKKKSMMGHITDLENAKVDQAFYMARGQCIRFQGSERKACYAGLKLASDELKFSGFSLKQMGS